MTNIFSDPIASVAFVLLKEFIPSLTRVMEGEKGSRMARGVLNAAKRVTGERRFQDIFRKLSENPAVLMEFQKEVLSYEKKVFSLESADFQNARARDVVIATSGRNNFRADVMVFSAAVGLVGCLGILALFREALPGEAVGIISTIAGIFGSCLKDAYAFEFGSSRGSQEKDKQMAAFLGQKQHEPF